MTTQQIINGDCLEVMKDIPPESVSMIFTDPPYGMNLDTDLTGAKSSLGFAEDKGIFGGKKYDRVIGDDRDFDPDLRVEAVYLKQHPF